MAWDLSHSTSAAQLVTVYLAGPASRAGRILFIVILALVVRTVLGRLIKRITERAATATLPAAPNGRMRKAAVALTILGILGFDLAPLLASTTVLGVALGFGAQNLVRDYLAGILMLVEDHYGVNESQGCSRAVIDYPVPYGEDLSRVRQLMDQAADSLYRERSWRQVMLEKPEVWGAQELSSKEVTMRIVVKTAPMQQWTVARELRARVKAVLDAAGIAPAGPDTIVITAPSGPAAEVAAEAGASEEGQPPDKEGIGGSGTP